MNPNFNIVSYFLKAADENPEKPAIIDEDGEISFGTLKKHVEETVSYYHSKGIRKGDRVLVFVPMSRDLYRSVLALFYLGATAVFLDEWVSKKRMEACCRVAPCQAFIGIPKARILAIFSRELRRIPIKLCHKHKTVSKQFIPISTKADDTALITFTTGSTGTPKAAKRTHGFLNEQFQVLIEKIDAKKEDVNLTILPIVLLINLGVGSTSVLCQFKASKPESMNASQVLDFIDLNKVSRIIASPYFVKQLALHLKKQTKPLSHLQKIYTGGAPVFQADAQLITDAFSPTELEIVYGSTEAEPISMISGTELIRDSKSIQGLNVGIPARQTQVKIIRISSEVVSCETPNDLDEISLKPGELGEIIVSGDHVLREYINNPEALLRNKIFIGDECWHRTGDSGFLDETGNLYLCGRCESLISAENGIIAPFVYENILLSNQAVEMASILKLNDELVLIIELKKAAKNKFSVADFSDKMRQKGLVFHRVLQLTKIPRDPRHHSKIDYGKLRTLVE